MTRSDSSFSTEEEHSEQTLGSTTRPSRNIPVTVAIQSLSEAEDTPSEPDLLRLLILLANHDYPIVPQSVLLHDATAPKSSGAFGAVAKATWVQENGTSKVVAVKRFHHLDVNAADNSEDQKRFRRALYSLYLELEIMARSSSPYIAKALAVSFQENDNSAHSDARISPLLILDPADFSHPDLSQYFRNSSAKHPIELSLFKTFTSGIALGLQALHRLGVVHADLKPANVLLFRHEGQLVPKLADFGISGITASGETPRGGTREWNAPECLPGVRREVSVKASLHYRDIYSFGLVVAYMLQDGNGPFDSNVDNRDQIKLASEDSVFDHIWKLIILKQHLLTGAQLLGIQEILKISLKLTPEARSISLQGLAKQLTKPQINSHNLWSIFTRKKPSALTSHTPFSSTKIAEMANVADPVQLFAFQDLSEFLKAPERLPQSFLKALSNQLAHILKSITLRELRSAWTVLARFFIEADDLESVFTARPEIRTEYENIGNQGMMYLAANMNQMMNDLNVKKFLFEAFNAFSMKLSDLHLLFGLCDAKSLKLALNDLQNGIKPVLNRSLVTACFETLKPEASSESNLFRFLKSGKLRHFNLAHHGSERLINHDWEAGEAFEVWGWTLLHSAVLFNNTKAVEILLKQGANVNAQLDNKAPFNWTPIHLAVLLEERDIISLLLNVSDTDLWVPDRQLFAFTVAHYAAEFGTNKKILEALLDHDPSLVVARDFRKRIPLHRAVATGRLDMVQLLVTRGADINAKDAGGNAPLHKAYAAANGVQGFASIFGESFGIRQQSIFNSATVSRESSRVWDLAVQDLSSQPSISNIISSNPEIVEGFEAMVKSAPPDHDVFQYFPLGISQRFDMITNTMCTEIRRTCATSTAEQVNSQLSYLRFIPNFENVKEIELNITDFVTRQKKQWHLSTDVKAPGQQGVTYLRDEAGRKIVYYLLSHGASPTLLSKTGYSPECFAYRPSDMFWNAFFDFGSETIHKPNNACFISSSTLLSDNQQDQTLSALYLKPLLGDFTIWKWLRGVIPAPYGLSVIVRACRFSSELDEELFDFEFVIEARMYPPNDAGNMEQQLLLKKYKIRDILPIKDRVYSLLLGSIPLKHKCDLLINIRSNGCSHKSIGGLVLFNMYLHGESSPNYLGIKPSFSKELGIIRHDISEHYHRRNSDVFHQYPDEVFKNPETFWHPPTPRAEEKPVDVKEFRSSLQLPISIIYTRKRLGLKDDGTKLHGERTWHYKEKRGLPTHSEMRDLYRKTHEGKMKQNGEL